MKCPRCGEALSVHVEREQLCESCHGELVNEGEIDEDDRIVDQDDECPFCDFGCPSCSPLVAAEWAEARGIDWAAPSVDEPLWGWSPYPEQPEGNRSIGS